MIIRQGRNWSQLYKKTNEINGRNTRSQLVATAEKFNDFKVATGRNTYPIYYVYRRTALGVAGTSFKTTTFNAELVGCSFPIIFEFVTTFLNPASWRSTKQRVRFLVSRVASFVGAERFHDRVQLAIQSLTVDTTAGWSQCPPMVGRAGRVGGSLSFTHTAQSFVEVVR